MGTAALDHKAVIAALAGAGGVEERWRGLTAAMAAIGMDQINYGIVDTAAGDRIDAPVRFLSTMRSDWIDHYVDRRFDLDDPHVKLVRQGNLNPYKWAESTLARFADKGERAVLGQAAEAGLRSQFQVTLPDADGAFLPVGGMAMGSSLAEGDYQGAIAGHEAELVTIAYMFHLTSIGEVRRNLAGVAPLTQRERDCLCFLADGDRIDRIAEKMGLARATIELHLRRARIKLKAQTLPQTIAKALYYREIAIG